MSNFWASKLGQQPPQPPAPAPAGPWWQTPRAVPQQAAPPPAVVPVTPQQAPPSGYGSGTDQVPIGVLLSDPNYQAGPKVQSARQNEYCPNCGGPNYLKPPGTPNAMPKCADCGSNPRFEQTMSGVTAGGGVQVTGSPTPARVQGAVGSNAPIGTVIGKA